MALRVQRLCNSGLTRLVFLLFWHYFALIFKVFKKAWPGKAVPFFVDKTGFNGRTFSSSEKRISLLPGEIGASLPNSAFAVVRRG